jgi:L-asparagine transporter-like permease
MLPHRCVIAAGIWNQPSSSAINATLFSTARLTRDVSAAGELPAWLGREKGGLPVWAVLALAFAGAAFSWMPVITEIVAFGSLTFLLVFGLINMLYARHTAAPGLDRVLAYIGAAVCGAATGGLLYYLARSNRLALALIAVCLTVVAISRVVFVKSRLRAPQCERSLTARAMSSRPIDLQCSDRLCFAAPRLAVSHKNTANTASAITFKTRW